MAQLKIGVVGAAGRMGKMNITEILEHNNETILSAALERPNSGFAGMDAALIATGKANGTLITEDADKFISECDAVIDFSSPSSTLAMAEKAAKHGKIHIIGTTGLSKEEEKLKKLSENCRIVYAPNMSLGVNLLFALVKKVAATLDEDYDIEIVEMHHNKKVDSPSGTALGLGKAAAEGRNVPLDKVWCKSRDGHVGARKRGEIGFATLRGGDVVGDHTVMFATEGERIELTHKASSRGVFAKGAVKAAVWASKQKNGFYSMQNVLGF